MSTHPLKLFLYHHTVTAYLYNIIRTYRRDKRNKLSDEDFARWQYKQHTGKYLDLDNPKTYDEKVWYLKLHERDSLQTKCSDKLLVRDYVKECGLGHILNEVYGVYDSFKAIPFDELPDRFFIKCTHTSGANAIYDRNKPFDYAYQKNEFGFWMKRDYFWGSREWNYKGLVPKIICEEILEDKNGRLPMDYKIMCFGGKAKMLFLNIGLSTETGEHADDAYCNIYDRDFNLLPIKDERENYTGNDIVKPANWDEMIEYAEILSKPFRHCRVDLYNVDGKIYFGEITFHHGGGCNGIEPEEWAYRMGDWIDINSL
jgi:hypothetical protein